MPAVADALRSVLVPVRRRQRLVRAVRGLTYGLAAGSSGCVLLVVCRWLFSEEPLPVVWPLLTLVITPIAGAVLGACWPCHWQAAARALDQAGGLRDRTSTAWQLATAGAADAMQRLQLQDTLLQLQAVSVAEAVPRPRLRGLLWSASLAAAACVLWLSASLPKPQVQEAVRRPDQAGLQDVVQRLTTDLQQLEQLLPVNEQRELQGLLQELRQSVAELQRPDSQTRDTLAALSVMQQALRAQREQYQAGLRAAQLQALAAALADVSVWESAAAAMQLQDLQQAAELLNRARTQRITAGEARTAAERLQQVAEALQQSGLSELQERAAELADSLQRHDLAALSEDNRQLAQTLQREQRVQDAADLLQQQLERLAEYKELIRHADAAAQQLADGTAGAGLSAPQPTDSAQSAAQQTDVAAGTGGSAGAGDGAGGSGGRSAGRQRGGPVLGTPRQLESRRQLQRLTGQLGDGGQRQTEAVPTQEARQTAERPVQDVVAEYQRRSQLAVSGESVPYGQREAVRRYFEALRQVAEAAETAAPEP